MSDALYLVDGSGFIFRAFHALPPFTTRQGVPTGAAYGFAQMLLKLEQDHRPSHLAVIFDAGDRSFRHEIDPGYKADRPPPPPELAPQFDMVRRVVEAFGVPQFELAEYEADDIIATFTREAREQGLRVVIVSSDKDLMQLVSREVVLVDTMKDMTYGPAEVEAKFGVRPEQLGDVLALMGDAVDSVPGVPGVGPKTAAAIIQQFGSLSAALERTDELGTAPGMKLRGAERIRQLLKEHAETARRSRRLVALDEHVPLPVSLEALRRKEPDLDRVVAVFHEYEFDRLLERLRPAAVAMPSPGGGTLPPPPTSRKSPARPLAEALALPEDPVDVVRDRETLGRAVGELAGAEEIALGLECGEGPPSHAPLCGVALYAEGHRPVYVPVGHRYLGAPTQLGGEEALGMLAPLLSGKTPRKRVHRSKDAYLVLARFGIKLDGVVGDPELAAYLVDPERVPDLPGIAERFGVRLEGRGEVCGSGRNARPYETLELERAAAYAGRRAAAALRVERALAAEVGAAGMQRLYEEVELPLARVLAVIERHGVRLDTGRLRTLGRELEAELGRLEAEVHGLAGREINLGSPKQLQELLFDQLGLPPVKRTKTGLSTDAEVLEELAPLHPVAAKIHEHRFLAKLKSTYLDALPALVDPRTGRVHTRYYQAVAATGRLSSAEPNLQNIPIRSELGKKIRRAFVAEEGYRLVAADYSQIELRVLAHLSHDPVLCDAFRRAEDVHQRTAAEVFHVAPEAVTGEMRNVAKAINFGLIYGQTDYGLSKVLGIHKAEARKYIDAYMARYAGVARFMNDLVAQARRELVARTLLGRIRHLPDLESKNRTTRSAAERMARNTPIQGTAADLLKLAMIQVQGRLEAEAPRSRMLLTVHDELVLEAPEAEAERVGALVREAMEKVWTLEVPLAVDVGIGADWAEC
ncbi:MAG TPA: DNA polymerase I [Polyangia bacterium]|nr:DNA polymerase I [Polyangia bacterium]